MFKKKVVTICPLSPISTQGSVDFAKTVMTSVPLDYLASSNSYLSMIYFVMFTATLPSYNDSVREMFGSTLTNTILSCTFNQQACNKSNFRVI
jgi:hypothetical protein